MIVGDSGVWLGDGQPSIRTPTSTRSRGQDQVVRFQLRDTPASDNYGVLQIQVRKAKAGDCTGYGAAAFETTSKSRCVAALS